MAAERYDASFFRSFRSQNIVEVTTDYAKVSHGAVLVYLYCELLLALADTTLTVAIATPYSCVWRVQCRLEIGKPLTFCLRITAASCCLTGT